MKKLFYLSLLTFISCRTVYITQTCGCPVSILGPVKNVNPVQNWSDLEGHFSITDTAWYPKFFQGIRLTSSDSLNLRAITTDPPCKGCMYIPYAPMDLKALLNQ